MCQIAWTETARGAERFAFQHDFPIELRFGLHIEPALWTSAELVTAHLVFQVFHRHLSGEVLRYHRFESFDRADLPGADVPDLWAGMALGQAGQVTQSGTLAFSGVLSSGLTCGSNERVLVPCPGSSRSPRSLIRS